jgi:quercetin dioxygenase-like cupin family protein
VPFGGALLKAECRDKGWMEITVDDRPVQRYRLEPKSILKWRIEKTFHIQIERSGLLTLWLDGQKVQLGEQTALYVGPEPVSDGQ